MIITKKATFCKDCGKPAEYHDPYAQCKECWEEWWSTNDDEPTFNKMKTRKKWDDE